MKLLCLSFVCLLSVLLTGVDGTNSEKDATLGHLQTEKSPDYMVVKKKDGYKKKFVIKPESITETPDSDFDELLNATLVSHERQKRQSDATTEVVGLRLNSAAGAGEYNQLKQGAREVGRPSRRRRSINFSFHKFIKFGPRRSYRPRRLPRYGPPRFIRRPIIYSPVSVFSGASRTFMTQTQRFFNSINYNYDLARRFLLSNGVQSNPINVRMVVTNPRGVTCEDVCDPDGGVGYGTIGICTHKFCKCDFHTWNLQRYNCPRGCVFDPLKLRCDYPQNTVLCSDDDFGSNIAGDFSGGADDYSFGWSPSTFTGGYSK